MNVKHLFGLSLVNFFSKKSSSDIFPCQYLSLSNHLLEMVVFLNSTVQITYFG